MSLAHFTIIVACDSGNGIAKEGAIPWNSSEDMKFFRNTTVGRGKNAVIMGRVTYESIPEEHRPLKERRCIVVSNTWKQEQHPEISVYSSLVEALAGVGSAINSYDEVFIAGGEQIYLETIKNFMYLCRKIYVTKFKNGYTCDQFFPWDSIKDYPQLADPAKTRDYSRFTFLPKVQHDEYQYVTLLKEIADNGEQKMDRTGTGVLSTFGSRMEFDLRDRLPILTTKKVFFDKIIRELLFFVSGKTDTKILEEQKVNIWKSNTTKKFLQDRGLTWDEGDMGPGYGFQWRHWGTEYTGCHNDYSGKGVDQLKLIIENLKKEPHSRRHILMAWNVSQLDKMALPPCHMMCQFSVSGDKRWLDCQVYLRSNDMFLGAPFNITQYALLANMVALVSGLKPRRLIYIIGNADIYLNHQEQVKKQLGRMPRPFPTLNFREPHRLHDIDDFTFDSFIISGYTCWPHIEAPMNA